MKNKQVYDITLIAVFTALIVVLASVPMLGFITIGVVSLTIVHIPVLIGGVFGGRKVALSLGVVFGISSLIVALTRPVTPVDLLFQNPLISVVPRMLFGWALYEVYVLCKKYIGNRLAALSVSMVVSTFLHTVFVLVPLFLFGGGADVFGAAFVPFLWAVMLSNGFWEVLAAGLIAAPIADRLMAYRPAA